MPTKWTFEDALPIIRAIYPIARGCHFSLALRGSVLLLGEGDDDLDLCFLSEDDPEFCTPARVLEEIAKNMPDHIARYSNLSGGARYPHSIIRLRDGRCIDAQFWI